MNCNRRNSNINRQLPCDLTFQLPPKVRVTRYQYVLWLTGRMLRPLISERNSKIVKGEISQMYEQLPKNKYRLMNGS